MDETISVIYAAVGILFGLLSTAYLIYFISSRDGDAEENTEESAEGE